MNEDAWLEAAYEDRFTTDDLDQDDDGWCNWCGNPDDDCECER